MKSWCTLRRRKPEAHACSPSRTISSRSTSLRACRPSPITAARPDASRTKPRGSSVRAKPRQLHPTSRLDVGVSGVVLFALTKAASKRLLAARERGDYLRHYVALAARAPAPCEGSWAWAIGRARDPRKRRVDGRDAVARRNALRDRSGCAERGRAPLRLAPHRAHTPDSRARSLCERAPARRRGVRRPVAAHFGRTAR